MTVPTGALTGVSAVKLALMAKQAREQLGAIARAEPIAVIGMGCRFPGGADSPEAFWALLRGGVDAVGPIPRSRWSVEDFHDPDIAAPGKIAVDSGGFIEGVDQFDAQFFGIIRREAERMDPQHRVFLEVAVDALDRAGLSREHLAGSDTGVFIASYHSDYSLLQFADRDAIDARTLTGTQHSVLANRLSYLLDLRGPSISIDTACSSSLVAIHLACQSLRSGESSVTLAGGVSLMLSPEMMITLSKVGFMSPSGRCRTFDALADGFIRGEGCGVVVLKRLSDAIADGDRVLSVIRGTAVNQDGHSTVLAAPNGLAQQALLREALSNAQLTSDRVGFVETHGTATPLGDPIEVEALAATIGAPRADGSLCYLGSAKANLGHMEAASGVAGLIKATLVLQHGEIPKQVHFTKLNPHLSLAGTCLAVADQHRVWPAGALPRVAGVSGFGVGGTNAHVLLEEAPQQQDSAVPALPDVQLLPLSAQSHAALHALVEKWIPFLEVEHASLPDICATAGERRSHYDFRLAVTGGTAGELAAQLRAFQSADASSTVEGHRAKGGAPKIAFVFSGQGPQWPGMGRELMNREPVFRDALTDLDARFRALAGWSLLAALDEAPETSRLMETELAQPAIFAIQVALAALWHAWGVQPDVVVGHSIGELAAMHVAGVLPLDEAVRIVFHRGRIMQRATGHGRMAAVSLNATDAAALVAEIGPALSLAAVNGPHSTVIAGAPEALQRAVDVLAGRQVQHRELPVSYAFHSAQMAPFEAELAAAIGSVRTQPARVALYSTVTGGRIDHGQIDAAYFGRNVRTTVRFAQAVDAMIGQRVDAFVELSPHPVLAAPLAECAVARGLELPVLASMRRGRSERETMLQTCGALYMLGITPRWDVVSPLRDLPVDLPSYPWQRQRYWVRDFDRYASGAARSADASPLLGTRTAIGDDGTRAFDAVWPALALRWLADHRIAQQIVMPGAAMVEMLRAAAVAASDGQRVTVTDFVVHDRLLLSEGVEPRNAWRSVVLREAAGLRLELHATGDLSAGDDAPSRYLASARAFVSGDAAAPEPMSSAVGGHWHPDTDSLYERFAAIGVPFGPAFRTIDLWRVGDDGAEGWLVRRVSATGGASTDGMHATVLDGVLQLCVIAITSTDGRTPGALMVPLGIESFTVLQPVPERVRAVVRIIRDADADAATAQAQVYGADGQLVAIVTGVRFAPVSADALQSFIRTDDDMYSIGWRRVAPAAAADGAGAAGRWIVLTNGADVGVEILRAIRAAGGQCATVRTGPLTAADGDGWTVREDDAAGLQLAMRALTAAGLPPVRGIVHLWSSDAAPSQGTSVVDPDWYITGSALSIVQLLAKESGEAPLWLVTVGAQGIEGAVLHARQAGLWGLANVIAVEHAELTCRVVDLEPGDATAQATSLVGELVRTDDSQARIALRRDERYAPVLTRYRSSHPRERAIPYDARLVPPETGALDELRWAAAPIQAPGPGEVRVRVHFVGVNFRDVLLSLGVYAGTDGVLGAECCGVVEAIGADVHDLRLGDRVFGLAQGSMASSVVVPAAFVVPLPDGIRPEQAAALPVAFLTGMLGLYRIARIGSGTRVLIHAAAGGVGLAAVQLAQRCGAEVHATAGSAAKREYLRSLGVQHVYDSRSLAFADEVLAATDGRGVDVVLNSLAGDFIAASVRALATDGWLLELGKRDVWSPQQMASARPDVRYRVYDLGSEANADQALVRPMLAELLAWLADGSLRPLPTRTFDFIEVSDAFRFMAQARHIGKLVLRAPRDTSREREAVVRADGTYLITGGTGALGVRTARWLAESGARCVVLTGRRAPAADAAVAIGAIRAIGVEVHVRAVDAGDIDAMTALLHEIAADMPPLRGVVHAAGTTDDGVLLQYTPERARGVLRGKAHGARVLDQLTQFVPLDFFVMYSSVGLHLGPIGQGLYAAANAELDALASSRRGRGLPALSVAWGQWPDAGMAAALTSRGTDVWSTRGLGWIEPSRAFVQLERLLRDGATYAAIAPMDWRKFLARLPSGLDRDFFRAVASVSPQSGPTMVGSATAATAVSLVERWRAAPSSAWNDLVLTHVAQSARHVLGVDDIFPIATNVALKDVGLDSLMAVELRNVLTRSLQTSLPATLLFDYPSLTAVAGYLQRTFNLRSEGASSAPAAWATVADAAIAALSDDEAEALLMEELNALDAEGRR